MYLFDDCKPTPETKTTMADEIKMFMNTITEQFFLAVETHLQI